MSGKPVYFEVRGYDERAPWKVARCIPGVPGYERLETARFRARVDAMIAVDERNAETGYTRRAAAQVIKDCLRQMALAA